MATCDAARHTCWLVWVAMRCTCDPVFWSRPVLVELWGATLRGRVPDFGRFEK